jgi:hypothetical protein
MHGKGLYLLAGHCVRFTNSMVGNGYSLIRDNVLGIMAHLVKEKIFEGA